MFDWLQSVFEAVAAVVVAGLVVVGIGPVTYEAPVESVKETVEVSTSTTDEQIVILQEKLAEEEELRSKLEEKILSDRQQETGVERVREDVIQEEQYSEETSTSIQPINLSTTTSTTTETLLPDSVQIDNLQIFNVQIFPSLTSIQFQWETSIPSNSKIFLSGNRVFNSTTGLSTRHIAYATGLSNSLTYSYEIESISGNSVAKKQGFASTNIPYQAPINDAPEDNQVDEPEDHESQNQEEEQDQEVAPESDPQFDIKLSSDKSTIGANGIDSAVATVQVLALDGSPVAGENVMKIYPESELLVTDQSGIVTTTITAVQEGNVHVGFTINERSYEITINAVSTTADVEMTVNFPGDVASDPNGGPRAPASDQILGWISLSNIDSSISNLKLNSIKLKLVNLDTSWFQNVRITNSPPCTSGRFCDFDTLAGPATFDLNSSGVLSVSPNDPVEVFVGKVIYIIADTIYEYTGEAGTGDPAHTYQISLNDSESIELTGEVNGYIPNKINLLIKDGLIPVTATIKSNWCYSSQLQQHVPCY